LFYANTQVVELRFTKTFATFINMHQDIQRYL